MAKKGMRRYQPGNGMESGIDSTKDAPVVPEIQGKAKQSNQKIENRK